MTKTYINNRAQAKWTPVIESRLQIMLGSMLSHIRRIDIEFIGEVEQPGVQTIYCCKLTLLEVGGEEFLLRYSQADGSIAIEGAFARARRAMTRLSRVRGNVWNRFSEQ